MSIVRAGGFEIPLGWMIAKHRPSGIKLPKMDRWKAPIGEPTYKRLEREQTAQSRMGREQFESLMRKEEFYEGDFQYWVGVPPETRMVICRVCGLPVRNEKGARKAHLRSGHCSDAWRKFLVESKEWHWCTVCGRLVGVNGSTVWHWGLKFCDRECKERFKEMITLSGPSRAKLAEYAKEFGVQG